MDQWKLWFVLLLPLCLCFDYAETLVKTIGSKSDVTPICTNETLNIVTLLVCKIRTERNRGKECRLLYLYGQEFVNDCDSRFTFMTENQTVFLHLTSLTPEDSGNYTCDCSCGLGTYTLNLSLTVEEDEDASRPVEIASIIAVIGVTIFIIMTGVILGFTLRKFHHRHDTRSGEPPCSSDQDDPEDTYASLDHPARDLYQTISSVQHQRHTKRESASSDSVTAHLDNQERDGKETDPSYNIYEVM